MGSINFLQQAYNVKQIEDTVKEVVEKQKIYSEIKKINKEIVEKFSKEISSIKSKTMQQSVLEDKILELIDEKGIVFDNISREELIKIVLDEVFGYSILQKYIEDPEVNDIMVNDYKTVFIRKGMTDIQVDERFENEEVYNDFLLKICSFIGQKLNASNPQVDGKDKKFDLRIYITTQPMNSYSPSLVIRKSHNNIDLTKVITEDIYPGEIMKTIELMQKAGSIVMFAGPMESGKTTMMNAYLNEIENERMVVMEDTNEILLKNPNTVYVQTIKATASEQNSITLADLVKNFKRSNGTMPIVSEVRGIEAVELLDVFNSGFTRGATSIHANSPIDVIRKLVFQIKASNKIGTDRNEIEEYIASSLDIIVYMEKRKIVSISEVYFDYDTRLIQVKEIHKFNIEKETKNEIFGKYETCVNPFSEKMLDRIRRVGLLDQVPEKLRGKN